MMEGIDLRHDTKVVGDRIVLLTQRRLLDAADLASWQRERASAPA